ncbi:MAG: SIR2 family protein [Candidatus Sedimenticola sp. (ex Thyasira tokunagai)]
METHHKIWCDEDHHRLYEYYTDFNEWLDGEEGQELRKQYRIDGLNQPSKAFYAGDKEAYEEAFRQYRIERRHEVLNQAYLEEQFGGDHWAQRNHDRFMQLIDRMESGQVVPFVGAGISASARFPSWKEHLREQGRTAGMDPAHIEALLSAGAYEAIIEQIEHEKGIDVFAQEIRDVFSRTHAIPETVWRISELFKDTVITTNYDRLLELAYDTGEENAFQIINGVTALERVNPEAVTIYKLHGDVQQPAQCILSKNQYDQAYGDDGLNLNRQIPKLLAYHYKTSSLLFLGSSLNEDRTVQVFRAIKESLGDEEIPQHFSIEQAPEDEAELVDRNAYLRSLGITPIWFEIGCFDYVEGMLQQVKNELSHRGVFPGVDLSSNHEEDLPVVAEIDFSDYLSDFVDLMPLLYWLRRQVPQSETSKYLSAMQRVFHAYSHFTSGIDEDLLYGLDNLLRVVSSSANFDGYSHGKLSTAFAHFQQFLQSHGQHNYVEENHDWDMREIMTTASIQFEGFLASGAMMPESDRHAIRLIVALLHHGKNQLHSPKRFCELPDTVSPELSDYLAFSLASKLGVVVPDRLDQMLNSDIRELCEVAWANFDRTEKPSFLAQVKVFMLRFSRRPAGI